MLAVLAHAALNTWYTAAVQGLAPDALPVFTSYAALLVVAAATLLVWRLGPEHLASRPRQRWARDVARHG